jgi:CHAD domain-containing protein
MIVFKVKKLEFMGIAVDGNTKLETAVQLGGAQISLPAQQVGENNLLVTKLEIYWVNFIRHLTACQENASVESVHDIRVATRRLLTLFELIQLSRPMKQIKGMQKELKLLREHFDGLRDTQVMIAELTSLAITIPGIESFLEYLHKRELKYKGEVDYDISTYKVLKNTRKLNIASEKILKQKMYAGKLERKITQHIDDSYRLVNKRMRKLDPGKPLTFHAVRIACRMFRYQVEVINSLFLDYPPNNMPILKAFQDKLGEIQNHEVMETILKKYARKNPDYQLDEIKEYLDKKLGTAIHTIMTEDAQLDLLWRPSRKKEFPWKLELDSATEVQFDPGVRGTSV